ncbi:TyrR/PhhR family helix-turn-helix DNA-binding protein [Marinomonas sp. IMCC 4694]|uniref:TyrR/PhhR family helix-turn-helix DNA-binding protein n=1 Tax=Marinomonas sp. IMCC 4694 TaxID=2605432 RepID=UPI0011E7F3B0|nr:TyrR/PhhR family helix-turn-helix DNA-binding protein [Marinomonas sp. IMCC 4694]TYL47533.1 transcriptional regulator [Marinomonas sp. IMCC 4694]
MRLEIQCEDRIGMMHEALDLFIPHDIDIRLVEVDAKRRCIYCGFSDIPFSKLQRLLAEIRRLDSVEDVKTVMFTPSEREHNALYTLLEALPDGVISVDLKGQITMVTALAAKDLKTPVYDLLHKPLAQFIKGIHVTKETWANPREGLSKRIRLHGKTLLLEMKPIFVKDEAGAKNAAGTVIYLTSKTRVDRESARLIQAPEAEHHLEHYFQSAVLKSVAMSRMLSQAKRFVDVSIPLLIQGEVGTGKRYLLDALFQYWYQRQGEIDALLMVYHAKDITSQVILDLDNASGWLVIEHVECLGRAVQGVLFDWLARQSSTNTSLDTAVRVISTSSLDLATLARGEHLSKDVYFTLSALTLSMPPLRERQEDLEGLVQQINQSQSERYRLPLPTLSKGARMKIARYDWPGNLKELRNICLQTLLTKPSTEWQADDILLPDSHPQTNRALVDHSLEITLKQWEAELLMQLYPRFPSTRKLAKAVGMSHSAIANKLKEHGIKT